jgi:RNA-splicing ligase RtcB
MAPRNRVKTHGARWAVSKGYGTEEDLEYTEEHGQMAGADLLRRHWQYDS